MATVCYCIDGPDSTKLRESWQDAHFAYIESIMDRLLIAGPLGGDEGPRWQGSLFVYHTDDRQEAASLLHKDPYFKAGIWSRTQFRPFLPAAGMWIGGGLWQADGDKTS